MSAGITFWCDAESAYGTCPQVIHLRTTDLTEARSAAVRSGWQLSTSATGDRCALYHAPKRGRAARPERRIR